MWPLVPKLGLRVRGVGRLDGKNTEEASCTWVRQEGEEGASRWVCSQSEREVTRAFWGFPEKGGEQQAPCTLSTPSSGSAQPGPALDPPQVLKQGQDSTREEVSQTRGQPYYTAPGFRETPTVNRPLCCHMEQCTSAMRRGRMLWALLSVLGRNGSFPVLASDTTAGQRALHAK